MLFKPQHKEMILNGTKTQTRRAWKKPMAKIGGIYKCKLQMLSKEYFAKIEVIKMWREYLDECSEEDAIKEGYGTKAEYLKVFEEINPKYEKEVWSNPKEFPKIWVIEFKLVEVCKK